MSEYSKRAEDLSNTLLYEFGVENLDDEEHDFAVGEVQQALDAERTEAEELSSWYLLFLERPANRSPNVLLLPNCEEGYVRVGYVMRPLDIPCKFHAMCRVPIEEPGLRDRIIDALAEGQYRADREDANG